MTDTIWLVATGEYSDYRIVGAFSDEAIATAHVEEWNELAASVYDRYVQGYAVSAEAPKLAVLHYAGWTNRHGDNEVWAIESVEEIDNYPGKADHLESTNYRDGTIGFSYSSFDKERAIKVVSDARAKTLAQAAGL